MCNNMYTNNDHILPVMLFVSDIVDYMGDGVTHIVTESKWDDNFDEVCIYVLQWNISYPNPRVVHKAEKSVSLNCVQ